MIVRTVDEVAGTERDVRGDGWRATRLFVRDHGLGFSLSETTVDAGREMQLWYKHHQEACFVIEGEAEITERDTGAVHRIGPGSGVRAAARSPHDPRDHRRSAWFASSTPRSPAARPTTRTGAIPAGES